MRIQQKECFPFHLLIFKFFFQWSIFKVAEKEMSAFSECFLFFFFRCLSWVARPIFSFNFIHYILHTWKIHFVHWYLTFAIWVPRIAYHHIKIWVSEISKSHNTRTKHQKWKRKEKKRKEWMKKRKESEKKKYTSSSVPPAKFFHFLLGQTYLFEVQNPGEQGHQKCECKAWSMRSKATESVNEKHKAQRS